MPSKYVKVTSPFQLVNHAVENLKISCGDIASLSYDDSHVIESIDYGDIDVREDEDSYWGAISLSIKVACKKAADKRKSVKCEIKIKGAFEGDRKEINDRESFENMLMVNGLTGLYSIARSVLISTSSQCLVNGHVRLPMINILNLIALATD